MTYLLWGLAIAWFVGSALVAVLMAADWIDRWPAARALDRKIKQMEEEP